ncbi:MFS general substrate transporter [Meredithblackwellia eburnea MCA 4105]
MFGKKDKNLVLPQSSSPTPPSEAGTLAEPELTSDKNKLDNQAEKALNPEVQEDESQYPSGIKLNLILMSMLLVNFLVALDQTIVAAAVPVIANDFHALSDVGWYGSAYLLTGTALQPLFGKAFAFFPKKWLFLACVTIFEVGSIICAASHDSKTFIVGRAIAGVGFGGLYIGILAIISVVLPVAKQGTFTSLIGACYGIGATIGPVIGGSFTTKVTWRWCFWINVPIGGVALVCALLFLNPKEPVQELSATERLKRMDWVGTVFLLGAVICLLLALQDGGVKHPWGDSRIYGLIIGFVLLFAAFQIVQVVMGENASINLRVLRMRSIGFAAAMNFTVGSTYFAALYYVPIYFQAVRGSSAIHSGVQALALIGAAIVTVIVSGALVESMNGRFNPQMYFGMGMAAIGMGLLSTLTPETSTGKWVGYQLIAGCIGAAFMLPYMSSQIILKPADRPHGATATIFYQTLGATILVSTANAIYQNELLNGLKKIPGLDVETVLASGVSSFRELVPANLLPAVILAANYAVSRVFIGLAVIASVGFLFSLPIEWALIDPSETKANLAGGAA